MIRRYTIPRVTKRTMRLCITLAMRNMPPSTEGPSQVCENIFCQDEEVALFIHKFAPKGWKIPHPIIKYSQYTLDGGTLCFPIDDLLFQQPYGRYQGKVYKGSLLVGYVEFDYDESMDAIDMRVENSEAPICAACE